MSNSSAIFASNLARSRLHLEILCGKHFKRFLCHYSEKRETIFFIVQIYYKGGYRYLMNYIDIGVISE